MSDFGSSFTASLLGNAGVPSSAWRKLRRSRAFQAETTKQPHPTSLFNIKNKALGSISRATLISFKFQHSD